MKSKLVGLWFLCLGPLLLLLAAFAYGGWLEYRAWKSVRVRLMTELREVSERMQQWQLPQKVEGDETERRRLVATAGQVSLMVNAVHDRAANHYDLSIATEAALKSIPREPHAAYPEAPIIERIMSDAKPIFEILDRISNQQDVANLGQTVDSLLLVRFRHAFHQGDYETAQRSILQLASIVQMGTIPLNQQNAATQLYSLSRHAKLYELFTHSLQFPGWDSSQIDEIAAQVLKPLDIAERLRGNEANKSHEIFSTIAPWLVFDLFDPQSNLRWTVNIDSAFLQGVLDAVDQSTVFRDIDDLGKSIQIMSQPVEIPPRHPFSILTTHHPDYARAMSQTARFAYSLGSTENERRLTLVAAAVRQFEDEHGRWPVTLSELEDKAEDNKLIVTDIGGQRLVYQHRQDRSAKGSEVDRSYVTLAYPSQAFFQRKDQVVILYPSESDN